MRGQFRIAAAVVLLLTCQPGQAGPLNWAGQLIERRQDVSKASEPSLVPSLAGGSAGGSSDAPLINPGTLSRENLNSISSPNSTNLGFTLAAAASSTVIPLTETPVDKSSTPPGSGIQSAPTPSSSAEIASAETSRVVSTPRSSDDTLSTVESSSTPVLTTLSTVTSPKPSAPNTSPSSTASDTPDSKSSTSTPFASYDPPTDLPTGTATPTTTTGPLYSTATPLGAVGSDPAIATASQDESSSFSSSQTTATPVFSLSSLGGTSEQSNGTTAATQRNPTPDTGISSSTAPKSDTLPAAGSGESQTSTVAKVEKTSVVVGSPTSFVAPTASSPAASSPPFIPRPETAAGQSDVLTSTGTYNGPAGDSSSSPVSSLTQSVTQSLALPKTDSLPPLSLSTPTNSLALPESDPLPSMPSTSSPTDSLVLPKTDPLPPPLPPTPSPLSTAPGSTADSFPATIQPTGSPNPLVPTEKTDYPIGTAPVAANVYQENLAQAKSLNNLNLGLTSQSACSGTQVACIEGQIARCNAGVFQLEACPDDQRCLAFPMPNAAGVSIGCRELQEAQRILGFEINPTRAPSVSAETITTTVTAGPPMTMTTVVTIVDDMSRPAADPSSPAIVPRPPSAAPEPPPATSAAIATHVTEPGPSPEAPIESSSPVALSVSPPEASPMPAAPPPSSSAQSPSTPPPPPAPTGEPSKQPPNDVGMLSSVLHSIYPSSPLQATPAPSPSGTENHLPKSNPIPIPIDDKPSSTIEYPGPDSTIVMVVPIEDGPSTTKAPGSSKSPSPPGKMAVVTAQAASSPQKDEAGSKGDAGTPRTTEVVNGMPTVSVFVTVTVTEKERETMTVTLLVPSS